MPESKKVVFMGDDSLQGAAAYLGGVMAHSGIPFDYVPSAQKAPAGLLERSGGLIIISDYPAGNLDGQAQQTIVRSVENGASLLMIGGWESFYGLDGGYHEGPVSEILPVECRKSDDRVNWWQGVIPWVENEHPVLEALPWNEPPIFCGYNETSIREDAQLVLSARKLIIENGKVNLEGKNIPLLAFGAHGEGRTAALTTDLAPHWVGGWVDWGAKRVQAQAPGGNEVEVGHQYAQFIDQLVSYLAG